jgi:hypothetical protein
MRGQYENKLAPVAENKSYRVPTGSVDEVVRVRLLEGGPVPQLDIRTFRRSPSDLSEDAFRPTSHAVTIEAQFAVELVEAIQRATAE